MRRLHAIFALTFALWLPRLASAQGSGVLTLADAVAEALRANHRVLDQRDAGTQADYGVQLAHNAFTPKIIPNVSGSFGQTNVANQDYRVDVTQKLVTGTQFRAALGTSSSQVPGVPGSSALQFYNADTTFMVSQPLMRGFGVNATRRQVTAAELRRDDAIRDEKLLAQQVAIETATAYYRLVAQRAYVDVARSSFDRAAKLRDASEAKLAAGLVSQLDVLRAEDLVSQAEIQVSDADAAVEDARDALSFVMGRGESAALDVATDIPVPNTDPIDAEAAVALAMRSRLELAGLGARIADSERQLAFARNQLQPQVDVNLALTRRLTANTLLGSFGFDRFNVATFFTIASPIDRTPQQIELANARIDQTRQVRQLEIMRRQVSDDVKRALRERDRLLRAYAAAETSISINRQEVEVAQLRYERGLSNNLDVVTAEGNLLAAQSRRIQVLAQLAVSRLTLRAVVGILDPVRDVTLTALNGVVIP